MAVDSGYEKRRKRKKKRKRPTRKLLVGEHVEVLYSDEGLRGSWHSGIVIDSGEYTRLVEYANLVSDDDYSKLKETIPVSAAIEGLPEKTTKYHRGHIRPPPPRHEMQESDVKYGLCVDALVDDAWWEGVVLDHAEGSKERLIFFPDQGDQQMVSMGQLRLTQEWNEVSGRWKPRGMWLLLQVLRPFEQEEELPVSVREIWFDLRTTAAFSKKIGVWTFGSQSTWHTLVSELIRELRSVVRGLNPFEREMDFPICYDTTVDIPNEEFPCLGGIDLQKNDAEENTSLAVALGNRSLSDGSSDERCAGESLSHQAAENMNTEGSGGGGLKKSDAFSLQKSKNGYCGSKIPILPIGENCGSTIETRETEYEEAIDFSRSSNRLARKNKGAGKAWKPVDLEAAFYPEAVKICASEGLRKAMIPDVDLPSVRRKAWKHLLALGWKIETRKDEKDDYYRVRFRSPEGKPYYSLIRACCALLQGHQRRKQKRRKDKQTNAGCGEFVNTKSHQNSACSQQAGNEGLLRRSSRRRGVSSPDASSFASQSNTIHTGRSQPLTDLINDGVIEEISSSAFEERWRTATHAISSEEDLLSNGCESVYHVYDNLDAGYFPKAVLEYTRYLELSSDKRKDVLSCGLNLIRLNARKHLKFMGWKFWVRGRPDRRCFFITSPSGKHFESLYSACDEYLRGENLKNSGVGASLDRVESRPAKISNLNRGFRDDKLSVERDKKLKRKKVIPPPSSLPSVTLGDRKVKHSSTKSSVCEKSKRRKECQALLRQGNELGNCLSPHGTEPRKRAQLSMLQTYSQRVGRTVLSELLDNGIISLRADVSYIRKKDGKVLMEGQITRDGIKCKCCKMVYTPSNFEAHAGSTHRRPAAGIFLQDSGKSLLECKMEMVQSKKPKDSRRLRMKVDCSQYKSDTVCTVCHDGGSLVLCDLCPSSFHLECVGLESVPKGKWFCPSCQCGACGMSEFNSDSEQFTEKTILYCDQCEREYHVGCMRKRGDESLSSCPVGNWFCSEKCSEIFLHLRQLLGISKPTSVEGLSLTILRSGRENGVDNLHFDAAIMTEHDSKLCVALNVLHECFVTITEPRTRSDFVADILFNRESELRRLNFYGFYTVLLEKGDELVSVATFRVYGDKVSEMPLVGTRVKYRNQGMCRLLVNELEKLLSELGVESLVLPAVPQLLQTWTSSFGFSKMTSSDRLNLLEYTILYFQETTMCRKLLKKRDPTVLSKPNGQFKKLMDVSRRSSKKGDSELNNSASEADGTMEPINASPSVHTDQFNQTGHQIEAEHSPISTCTNPIQQTKMVPGQNDLEKVVPPKFLDSNVSVDTSPILALMAPSNIDPKILKKCYERIDKDSSIRQQHTVKNANTGAENSLKYVYRRRMPSAN